MNYKTNKQSVNEIAIKVFFPFSEFSQIFLFEPNDAIKKIRERVNRKILFT